MDKCNCHTCYTVGENSLLVQNEYILKIKEFNWEPKYAEEPQNNIDNKVVDKVRNITISPILFSIIFIFGGMLLFCILGLFLYPQYASIYIGTLLGIVLYKTFKSKKY